MSPTRIHGCRLEPSYYNSGIPTSAPYRPKSIPPSVPPILCIRYQDPMSGYSKALRGLSVQSRVASIFTRTTTSPDLQLRQCPSHYAIRAGQNLPDKEFRYLRTVIVTAAVYWGLSSWLRFLTTPLNLPAPGRRQPIYLTFRFCIDLCFC